MVITEKRLERRHGLFTREQAQQEVSMASDGVFMGDHSLDVIENLDTGLGL